MPSLTISLFPYTKNTIFTQLSATTLFKLLVIWLHSGWNLFEGVIKKNKERVNGSVATSKLKKKLVIRPEELNWMVQIELYCTCFLVSLLEQFL